MRTLHSCCWHQCSTKTRRARLGCGESQHSCGTAFGASSALLGPFAAAYTQSLYAMLTRDMACLRRSHCSQTHNQNNKTSLL